MSDLMKSFPKNVRNQWDVVAFFALLNRHDSLFHPDDEAGSIVHSRTGEALFGDDEAAEIDRLMDQAHDVCAKDPDLIYVLAMRAGGDDGLCEKHPDVLRIHCEKC